MARSYSTGVEPKRVTRQHHRDRERPCSLDTPPTQSYDRGDFDQRERARSVGSGHERRGAGGITVSVAATELFATLRTGDDLDDGFIYYLGWEEYAAFPDPFPRRRFEAREVQQTVWRYPDPARPGE